MELYEKTKITFHNYFDLQNFKIILDVLTNPKSENYKRYYKIIQKYYNNKYGNIQVDDNSSHKIIAEIITNLKKKEEESIKTYGKPKDRHILQFKYDKYTGNSSSIGEQNDIFKTGLQINIYKDGLNIPIKNESEYKEFIKERISQELTSYTDKIKNDNKVSKNIHLFIPMKLNEQYSIEFPENTIKLHEKRRIQQSNIHKLLIEAIQDIITSERQYIRAFNNNIEPVWLNINLDRGKLDKLINSTPKFKPNNTIIKYVLFFAKYIHDICSLFKKKDIPPDDIIDINQFKIKPNFVIIKNKTETKFFDKNKKIDFSKKGYFIIDGKIISFKQKRINSENKKELLTVDKYDGKTGKNLGNAFVEITKNELHEGIVYSVKLFWTGNQRTKPPIYSVLKKKEGIDDDDNDDDEYKKLKWEQIKEPLHADQLNPSSKSRSDLFLFIKKFCFKRRHVYDYYNNQKKLIQDLDELTFMVDLFTIRKNLEDFYKYCLTHDNESFQNTILNVHSISDQKDTLELIIKLLLKKKRLIAKQTGTKELSKFQNQIDNIHIVPIEGIENDGIIETSVKIEIISKEIKDKQDPFARFDGEKRSCKDKKQNLFSFFKKHVSNKIQNTFKETGITLKQYARGAAAASKGGKKNTKKYKNKRRKKYTRKVKIYKT